MSRTLAVLAAAALAAPLAVGATTPPPASAAASLPSSCWGHITAVRPNGNTDHHGFIANQLFSLHVAGDPSMGFVPTAFVQASSARWGTGARRISLATTRGGSLYRVVSDEEPSRPGTWRGVTRKARLLTGWTGTKALVLSGGYLYRFSGSSVRRYTVAPGSRPTHGVTVARAGYGSVRTVSAGDEDFGMDTMFLTTREGRLERLTVPWSTPRRVNRTVLRRSGFGSMRAFSAGGCDDKPNAAFFIGVTPAGHLRGYYDPDARNGLAALSGREISSTVIPYRVYSD